jgi:ADP-heptose:LPS heptosyltransferase
VVTPDTGLLHLAVLLGVPALALFGGSDPLVAGLPAGAGRILRTGIECSPCRERLCQRRECLEGLSPETVAAALG